VKLSLKTPIELILSGRSSGVERNLAKVEVEGSNPFARSNNNNFLSFSIVGAKRDVNKLM
tara:strand:+ start:851 stop:1030 length:180 start_codon:yes stop_codon:yes gene_type:complete